MIFDVPEDCGWKKTYVIKEIKQDIIFIARDETTAVHKLI
jgi:hypothetical protein